MYLFCGMETLSARDEFPDSPNVYAWHSTRLPNGLGSHVILKSGQIVNVYDSGKHSVQGKDPDGAVKKLLSDLAAGKTAGRKVFVVYGHDEPALAQLEGMLRRWGLEPLILRRLPSEGQTVIEKLEHYQQDVDFGVVLATPDDEGHSAGKSDEKAFRVRQNVVLELGMLLARLGRRRVAILLKTQREDQREEMERPSDIEGLIYIPFDNDVGEAEAARSLSREMSRQGIQIPLESL